MASSQENAKTILFISELPDNIRDTELKTFFSEYTQDIYMFQVDHNQKVHDKLNTRKPRAMIYFKDHQKAKEAREKLNMRRLKGKALNIMWHERDNSIRYNNEANLFVKGIPQEASPREVYELFAQYGEIISCKICEDEDGYLHGYGYINYYNLDSAEKAIENLNKKKFKESQLEVQHFRKMNERYKPISENKTIYVKNIPKRVKDVEELKKIFGKFGKITWGDLYQDKEDRQFAILDFDTSEAARKAKEELGDKKLEDSDESGLYVDFLQKRSERRRMLTSKIGDINTKLNEENKNCNLYIKNIPYDLTEEKLKEIFSKCGEIKSSKIGKYILVTKVKDKFENIETSKGHGFVCYTKEEDAKKAIDEFNGKYLPGYENTKRPPIFISYFMPKYERKQILNKEASQDMNQMQFVQRPFMMYPPNFMINRHMPYRHPMYKRPQQQRKNQQMNNQGQTQQETNNMINNNNTESSVNKEDEPSFEHLQKLEDLDKQKDYLGEYLFKKIEQHPITHSQNLDIDTISKITGMILGIDNIKEIYDITTNNDNIEARIKEALKLLNQG